jgi:type I restriction enzyme S subunit
MRTKNIQMDLEDDDLVFIPRSPIKASKLLRGGDILVSSANSWNLVGKCCWVPNLPYQATFGGFTSVLRADLTRVFPRYLYHWFAADRTQQLARSFGQQTTNISNLNQTRCLELEIPLPPIAEQGRLATILDNADSLRRKRKHAIDLLGSLTQSVFLEMFGSRRDPVFELKDVVKKGTIVTYGIVQAGPEFPGGIPYIRTGDLVDGNIQIGGLKRTDPAIAARFSRSRVDAGDIVMSIRATVGTTAVVPPALEGANLTQGTARIAPGENVQLNYLLEYIRSESTQRWLAAQVKGATFLEITLGRLRELPVVVPPLDLQNEFSNTVMKVRREQACSIRQAALADSLFSSLQSRAFSGQL